MYTIIRQLILVLSLLFPLLSAAQGASATPSSPFNSYYLNPQPNTISEAIQFINKNDMAAVNKSLGTVIGFMSEIFRANPERVDQWLYETPLAQNTQVGLVYALWLADMHEAATQAMKRFQWAAADVDRTSTQLANVKNIDSITPNTGNDLDMFWGAFFASGNTSRIGRILFAYNYRVRTLQIDPIDILFVSEVMGTRSPNPIAIEKMQQLKTKYSERRAYDLVVAASALWALGSNAQQHDRVRDSIKSYLAKAVDDRATRTLEKQLAQTSTKLIAPTQEVSIFFLTTSDKNFTNGPLKALIEQRQPPAITKVFNRSESAFASLSALLKEKEQFNYQIEMLSPKGDTRRFDGKLSGPVTGSSITSALIPLAPEPSGDRGLYEIFLTVSGTSTPKSSFRTMVYFDYE